jgi:hypothetical protein
MPITLQPIVEFLGQTTVLERVPKEMLPLAENASTRICKRLGLEFKGEVNDPEDGWVWRW